MACVADCSEKSIIHRRSNLQVFGNVRASDQEQSPGRDRRNADSEESSESESDLASSEEDKKKNRKGKSSLKIKDGKKRPAL